jgi:flagellar hook-basal body complex protein FliE
MNTSPISNQFGPRLEKLNREINAGLSEVRRHLKELEEVEKNQRSSGAPARFADVLKESINKVDKNAK